SVAADTRLAMISEAPKIVSRLFGKLDAMRHFNSGCDCAMAGAVIGAVARPRAADLRNRRRFIGGVSPFTATGRSLGLMQRGTHCVRQKGPGRPRGPPIIGIMHASAI